MSKLRRLSIMLLFTLFLVPLLLLLLLFRHNFPTGITDLWTKPENRAGFIIGITSSIVYAIGASLLLFFRRAALRWTKVVVLRGRSADEERERVEQERLYLENLVERFRRDFPWEVNRYTDLEAIQEDLEKQAHRVQPLRRNLPNAEESRVEGNVRARVNVRSFLRSEKGPLMLKGEPGTGKTLTIRRFAVDQAENALKALPGEVKIPIYIFLGSYTQKTASEEPEAIYDFLQHYLEEEYPASGFIREHLTEYLIQGRLLLLFDGLNELPLDEYLPRYKKLEEFVLRKYPKNKAIFTCRTIRYTSLYKFNTIVISDLADHQIKRFIAAYRGEAAAEILYRELTTGDGFMLRICRNPFMLQMLVRRDPNRAVPQSPAQLYDEYVRDELHSITKDAENMIDAMRQVAFAMQIDGKFSGTVTSEWLRTQLPEVSLDDLLLIARNTQLVDYAPEKISFCHQILQEYFAALALKKVWEEGKGLESFFTDYRWDDTVLVCAGLIEESEKFIQGIWSPGKTSPDALWLAMKAVGISGRHRISDEYYDSLIREAKKYVGLSRRPAVIGYSPTVLAVDTVKALSYIDDDQTADILNKVIYESRGWLRELCIQALGSSRNPYARSLLRATLIKMQPLEDIFLAASYFSRREWLGILASSVLSIKRFPDYIISSITGEIKILSTWLNALFGVIITCLLCLALEIILSKMHLFDNIGVDILSGRVLSVVIFLLLVYYHFDELAGVVRSKENVKTQLKSVLHEFTWVDLLLMIPILSLWVFPTETLLLFGFLTIYIWLTIYIAAIITKTKNRPHIASMIYYHKIEAALLFGIVLGWGSLLSSIQKASQSYPYLQKVLAPSNIFRNVILVIASPSGYVACQVLISLIFASIIAVCLVTWMNYWRMQRYRNAYLHRNKQEAALCIKDIALKTSAWPQIRLKALKLVRLIELPYYDVEDFEKLIKDQKDYDIRRELERTVYELQARLREKDREGNTLRKRQIRNLANRGMDHRKMGRYEEALADFNQAISLNEKDIELIIERAIAYRQMKRYQEALADFDLAIGLNQKAIRTLSLRGETYFRMERYEDALADIGRIITLDEKLAWPFELRAQVHRKMNRYQEALNDYAHAIALKKKNVSALIERGLTYQSLGKYQEALADFNRVLAFDENNFSALVERGITYRLMEHHQEALADFDRAIALDEKWSWYRYDRALVFMLMGNANDFDRDLHTAIELAQNRLQSAPNSWVVRLNLALYNLVGGNTTDAESQFQQLVSA